MHHVFHGQCSNDNLSIRLLFPCMFDTLPRMMNKNYESYLQKLKTIKYIRHCIKGQNLKTFFHLISISCNPRIVSNKAGLGIWEAMRYFLVDKVSILELNI